MKCFNTFKRLIQLHCRAKGHYDYSCCTFSYQLAGKISEQVTSKQEAPISTASRQYEVSLGMRLGKKYIDISFLTLVLMITLYTSEGKTKK